MLGSNIVQRLARRTVGPITHFKTGEPVAALTFDDGPHPEHTPRLLEILARHNAQATFFMLGEAAQRNPEVVVSVAAAGHAIGIHSWDHPSFPTVRWMERKRQIGLCRDAVAPYGQFLFRPPYGHHSWGSLLETRLMGYETIMWNINGIDYEGHDGPWVAERLKAHLKPGSIILLHDSLNNYSTESNLNRSATLEAVELLLQCTGTNMRFLTIPAMFQIGKPMRKLKINKGDSVWLNQLKSKQSDTRASS